MWVSVGEGEDGVNKKIFKLSLKFFAKRNISKVYIQNISYYIFHY